MSQLIRQKVAGMLLEDSHQKNDIIAESCKTSASYVSQIRRELGLLKFKDLGEHANIFTGVSADNISFVLSEAKKLGVNHMQMIDAILTDARVEGA